MKNVLFSMALTITLLGSGLSAYAEQEWNEHSNGAISCTKQDSSPRCATAVGSGSENGVRAVPEIDATSGTAAIVLVLGVALLGAERLRRRAKTVS